MKPQTKHFINGLWCDGAADRILQTTNPATGENYYRANMASADQVEDAIQGARLGQADWSDKTLEDRIQILTKYADLVETHADILAEIISIETGKPLWESKTEALATKNKIAISIQSFHERTGTKIKAGDITQQVIHKPHGVMAVLGPYNFPAHLPNGHIVPALLAGNAVVFKPSECTPWSGEYLVSILVQAGVPARAVQFVVGDGSIGQQLVNHADIDGVLFTGSAKTGQAIHKALSKAPQKILALEMGGNNAQIVGKFEKTDIEAAVKNIIDSSFITAGQRCTCTRRLIVPNGELGDALISALVDATKQLVIDTPKADPKPFMGPVIHEAAAKAVINAEKTLLEKGATVLLSAGLLNTNPPKPGTAFVTPGILDCTGLSEHFDEEIFGPLLQIYRTDKLADAIQLANQTNYGLSAGLISNDEAEYKTFAKKIRAGIVNWNRPLTGASSEAPFGGVGDSGNHRPSAYYAADYCAYPVASLLQKSI